MGKAPDMHVTRHSPSWLAGQAYCCVRTYSSRFYWQHCDGLSSWTLKRQSRDRSKPKEDSGEEPFITVFVRSLEFGWGRKLTCGWYLPISVRSW